MSSTQKVERNARAVVKLLQFFASIYLIFALYNIGPYWILLIACLAIPVYGVYLLWKSPERRLKHPLPYVRYKALARAKSWLRVDLSICITMAVVCFGFSLVLLFGYFAHNLASSFLLQAAAASMLLCILYLLNAFLTARQLNMGTIDFVINGQQEAFATRTSNRSPLAVDTNENFASFPSSSETLNRENDRMLTLPRLVPVYERSQSSNENPTMLEGLRSELEDQQQTLDQRNKETIDKNVKLSLGIRGNEQPFSKQQKSRSNFYTEPNDQPLEDICSQSRTISQERFTQTDEFYLVPTESRPNGKHDFKEYAVDIQEMHLSSPSAKSPEFPYKSTSQPYNRRAIQPKVNLQQDTRFGRLNVNTATLTENSAKSPIISSPKSSSKDPMSSLQGDQNTTTNTNSTSTDEETEGNKSHFKRVTDYYPLVAPLSKQKAWATPVIVRPVILDSIAGEKKSHQHLNQKLVDQKDSPDLRYYRMISPATQKKVAPGPAKSTNFPVDAVKNIRSITTPPNYQYISQTGIGDSNRNFKKGFDVSIRPQTVPLSQSTELRLAEESVNVKTVSRADYHQATEF